MMAEASTGSRGRRWLGRAVLVGLAYLVLGLATAALARGSSSRHWLIAWRLAGWVLPGVVYAIHIGYEHARVDLRPAVTAWHAAVAVAFGAFGLAVAALLRALATGRGDQSLLFLALVVWPVAAGVPAFLVALGIGAGLARLRGTDGKGSGPAGREM